MYYLFKNVEYSTYTVSGNYSDLSYARALDQWALEDIFDCSKEAHEACQVIQEERARAKEQSECTTW